MTLENNALLLLEYLDRYYPKVDKFHPWFWLLPLPFQGILHPTTFVSPRLTDEETDDNLLLLPLFLLLGDQLKLTFLLSSMFGRNKILFCQVTESWREKIQSH